MARVLRMPDVASDEDEGVLAAWLVEESSTFDAAQTIAYVETESSLLSVEAGRPGVLVKALVEPGALVDPGAPIGVLADLEEQVGDLDVLLARLGLAEGRPDAVGAPPGLLGPPLLLGPPPIGGVEVLASPTPSVDVGPAPSRHRGRPVDLDAADTDADTAADTAAKPDEVRASHLVLRTTVRAEPLLRLYHDIDSPDVTGTATSAALGDLVVKTVATTCGLVPEVLGPRSATDSLDVALSVPGPDGALVTPVLRDVGSLSLGRIAETTRDLVSRAASDRLDPTEVEGGAVEVTDLAAYGVAELVAPVSPPRTAHVAFGAVRDEPVVEDGVLVPGKVVTITLSVDHERVDRLVAARWLAAFVDLLGRPARALV